MKREAIALIGIIMAAAWLAGCSQPPASSPFVQEPTMTPAVGPSVRPTVTAGPTDYVPTIYRVELQVDRNTIAINPDVIVTFRGGEGMNLISSLDVILTRSDGEIRTGTLVTPRIGDKVDLEGTTGRDRVEVIAHMDNGKSYTIYDRILPFGR
jgi:hypothetical protein